MQDLQRCTAAVTVGGRVHGAHSTDAQQLVDAPFTPNARAYTALRDVAEARMNRGHETGLLRGRDDEVITREQPAAHVPRFGSSKQGSSKQGSSRGEPEIKPVRQGLSR
jgi:hypothetical protein